MLPAKGFGFCRPLPPVLSRSLPFQLLRAGLRRSQPYCAEINGGKHPFTIRFMTRVVGERPVQSEEDVGFQLTRCIL